MIVDVVRQAADWLNDGSSGVNTLLASVPVDAGDATPPNVSVFDATREDWVARGVVPRAKVGAGPLLLVELADRASLPTKTQDAPGNVVVAIRYVARKDATAELLTDAYQTLRAAGRVLAARFNTVMGALTRNATDIHPPTDVQFIPELETLEGDELVACRIELTVPTVDAWGLAAIA